MSSDQPSQTTTFQGCAATLMETTPLIMQFIRAQMRSQSGSVLSVPQFRVLAFLDRHPGSSLSDVAEYLGVSRATASTMTDRLVKREYVNRSERASERRQVVLELTELGVKYLEQSREKTRDEIATLLNNLTEDDLSTISAGLTILKKVFGSKEIG